MQPNHPRLSLLGLPRELREEIYDCMLEAEQEEYLEIFGCRNNQIEHCLLLDKARPPRLGRVCRTTRHEYLPYYFKKMTFRVYFGVGAQGQTIPPCAVTDEATRLWKKSLRGSGLRFRRVQFRFVDATGNPIGASVNVVYHALRRAYTVSLELDDGWDVGRTEEMKNGFHDWHVTIGSRQMYDMLREESIDAVEEVLDWKLVNRLIRGSLPKSATYGIHDEVRPWSELASLKAKA